MCFLLGKFFKNYLLLTSLIELLILLSIIWRHFPVKKPLKSKNEKHTIVPNTKFYHPVRFELKRIKTVKVIPRLQFQADPACVADISVNFKIFFGNQNIQGEEAEEQQNTKKRSETKTKANKTKRQFFFSLFLKYGK